MIDSQDSGSNELPETHADTSPIVQSAVESLVDSLSVERKAELFDKLSSLPAGSTIHFNASSVELEQVWIQIRKKTAGAYPTYADAITLALAAEQL